MNIGEVLRLARWNPFALARLTAAKYGLISGRTEFIPVRTAWIDVAPARIPNRVYEAMCDRIDPLEDEGFKIVAWGITPQLTTHRRHEVLLRHTDGVSMSYIMALSDPNAVSILTSLTSVALDGRRFGTSGNRQGYDLPPQYYVESFERITVPDLCRRHRTRLTDAEAAGVEWEVLPEGDEMKRRSIQAQLALNDWYVQRGLHVELDDDEVRAVRDELRW